MGLSLFGVALGLNWAVSDVAWAHLGVSGWLIWGPAGSLGGGQANAAVDPRQMWLWLERESWVCGESCCSPSQKRVGTPKYALKATIPLGRSVWGIWGILPRNHPPY